MLRNNVYGNSPQDYWRSTDRQVNPATSSYTRLTSSTVPAKKQDSSLSAFTSPLAETYKKLLKRLVFM